MRVLDAVVGQFHAGSRSIQSITCRRIYCRTSLFEPMYLATARIKGSWCLLCALIGPWNCFRLPVTRILGLYVLVQQSQTDPQRLLGFDEGKGPDMTVTSLHGCQSGHSLR